MGKHGRDSVTIGCGCIWAGTCSGRPVGQLGSRVMPGSKTFRLQFSGRSVISLSNSSAGSKTESQTKQKYDTCLVELFIFHIQQNPSPTRVSHAAPNGWEVLAFPLLHLFLHLVNFGRVQRPQTALAGRAARLVLHLLEAFV